MRFGSRLALAEKGVTSKQGDQAIPEAGGRSGR